jgi:hypothetical protein
VASICHGGNPKGKALPECIFVSAILVNFYAYQGLSRLFKE